MRSILLRFRENSSHCEAALASRGNLIHLFPQYSRYTLYSFAMQNLPIIRWCPADPGTSCYRSHNHVKRFTAIGFQGYCATHTRDPSLVKIHFIVGKICIMQVNIFQLDILNQFGFFVYPVSIQRCIEIHFVITAGIHSFRLTIFQCCFQLVGYPVQVHGLFHI